MTIEFKKPEEGDKKYSPLPAGRYNLKVNNVSQFEASSGNKAIKVEFKIIDEKNKGRKVFRNFALSPTAIWALQEFAIAADVAVARTGGKIDENALIEDLNTRKPVVSAYNEPRNGYDDFKMFKESSVTVTEESDLPYDKKAQSSNDLW